MTKKTNFSIIFNDAIDICGSELGALALGVYTILVRHANRGQCYPSHSLLAKKSKLSRRTIITILSKLENAGLIDIQKRITASSGKSTNLYTINKLSEELEVGEELSKPAPESVPEPESKPVPESVPEPESKPAPESVPKPDLKAGFPASIIWPTNLERNQVLERDLLKIPVNARQLLLDNVSNQVSKNGITNSGAYLNGAIKNSADQLVIDLPPSTPAPTSFPPSTPPAPTSLRVKDCPYCNKNGTIRFVNNNGRFNNEICNHDPVQIKTVIDKGSHIERIVKGRYEHVSFPFEEQIEEQKTKSVPKPELSDIRERLGKMIGGFDNPNNYLESG